MGISRLMYVFLHRRRMSFIPVILLAFFVFGSADICTSTMRSSDGKDGGLRKQQRISTPSSKPCVLSPCLQIFDPGEFFLRSTLSTSHSKLINSDWQCILDSAVPDRYSCTRPSSSVVHIPITAFRSDGKEIERCRCQPNSEQSSTRT